VDNIKEYIEPYVTFGKAIPYEGLNIKPVLVKDFYQFRDARSVLKIDKNKIPDIEIIQMTYLRFIMLMMVEHKELVEDFLIIMSLCLGVKYSEDLRNIDFEPNELLTQQIRKEEYEVIINGWNVGFRVHDKQTWLRLYTDGDMIEITEPQFDDLCNIILFQNIYEYDDMEMSDDFRRIVEEYYALKNKDIVIPTLEDRLAVVSVSSSYKIDELYELPLKLFDALFEYSVQKLEYQVNKLIVNLAQGEIKGFNLSHWVYKTKKDKYSEIFTDAQALVKKVTSV
jgi:hypothetical protein